MDREMKVDDTYWKKPGFEKRKLCKENTFANRCTLEQRLEKSVPRCNYWGGENHLPQYIPPCFHLGFFP